MRTLALLLVAFATCFCVATLLNAFAMPHVGIWTICVPIAAWHAHVIWADFIGPRPCPRKVPLTENQLESAVRSALKKRGCSQNRITHAISTATYQVRIGRSPDEALATAIRDAMSVVRNEHADAHLTMRAA